MTMVNVMNFKEELIQKTKEVEQIIADFLPREEGFQKTIMEAMNYSIQSGGKRLRPMLLLETYRMFGGKSEIVRPFMAAMEMIHTYSLVHDDLPAMDDDEYRRGRKTTHVVYGEAVGILAGDALLNYAFETATRAFLMEPGNVTIGKALRVLATKSGIYGMVGGQTVDVLAAGKSLRREELDVIYRLKTGALIEASMMIGAILAGASEAEVKKVEGIAGKVGLAFQIQDDILDITSTTDVLGKPIRSDEKNEKTTVVTLLGLEQAQNEVRAISEQAITHLDSLPYENIFLRELIHRLISREK